MMGKMSPPLALDLPPFCASVLKPIMRIARGRLIGQSGVVLSMRRNFSLLPLTYHVLTCASVILRPLASWARSAEARYFCL